MGDKMLENVRQELERILNEHQQESGLHMIGGREKLVSRLLELLMPQSVYRREPGRVDQED
jgi:hypothetical protein